MKLCSSTFLVLAASFASVESFAPRSILTQTRPAFVSSLKAENDYGSLMEKMDLVGATSSTSSPPPPPAVVVPEITTTAVPEVIAAPPAAVVVEAVPAVIAPPAVPAAVIDVVAKAPSAPAVVVPEPPAAISVPDWSSLPGPDVVGGLDFPLVPVAIGALALVGIAIALSGSANAPAAGDTKSPASGTVDLSIPYDAAARLAYEKAGRPGNYAAFKEKYEADAVAEVIAKRKK